MLVQIDYHLDFAALFHMGTGISTNALDRTVVRNASGNLYVPASTFKGVLREQCECLLRFYSPAALTGTSAATGAIASPHDAGAALSELGQVPTLISRIFGSQIRPGSLRFSDARQDTTLYESMQTSTLTQVRIERGSRVSLDRALYTSEFGNQFLTFAGRIKGQLDCTPLEDLGILVEKKDDIQILAPSYSLLLLLAGLLMVERIGGSKSTGKGQCSCTITSVHLDTHPCSEWDREGQPGWRSWLEHLDMLSDYDPQAKGEKA